MSSCMSCTRLAPMSGPRMVLPVTFPPGCARLVTSRARTGSPTEIMTIGVVECDVLAFEVTEIAQLVAQSIPPGRIVDDADTRNPRLLLRACCDRPYGRRTSEKRDELAASHVEHGDFLPCRLASSPPGLTLGSPHPQPAAERSASPWARPESF